MINRSDAHPSLIRGCLYKQTAIYYFIGGVLDFDLTLPWGKTQGSIDVEWKRTLPGTPISYMKSFWSVAAEL